ncbi:MAG: DASS family sodium-coupled anion symporter, partial [Saprospiraceae bacterium]|nr:DASS family sodium-coupled anion symporter [Saprospiraceae bacterium]
FMLATALLSMWISNTATAVMMLPIGMAVVTHLAGDSAQKAQIGKILMLAIAYAASIGGVATLIGTPTNLVLAGVIEELYGKEISFTEWFVFGLPISIVLLTICWIYLTRVAGKLGVSSIPGGRAEIRRQLHALGKLTYEERIVGIVFAATALCWILRSFVLNQWLPGLNDTIIAIAGASILFFLPSRQKSQMLLDWEAAVRIPWGIILLFGGGLALAAGFQTTGLAEWIGSQLTLLEGVHLVILILVLIAAVNFLTEITSNVATASMILPILASLALAINVHPYGLMVAATVAASCAFMLPVATPPNAVVFGSGYLRIPDMVRTGIWMNLISIVLLTLAVYLLLPEIWQIDLHAPLQEGMSN